MEEIKVEAPMVVSTEEKAPVVPKKRGRGRPPKSDLQAVKDRTKGKVGRPKGDSGRLQEFKERLLATGGNRIIDTVVRIALTDGHPGQMAALKLALDRVLPVSVFEAAKNSGITPTVTINISSLGETPTVESAQVEVSDVDYRDVEEE
jgi:hypothetical protein